MQARQPPKEQQQRQHSQWSLSKGQWTTYLWWLWLTELPHVEPALPAFGDQQDVLQHRKGLIGKRELLYTVDVNRHELFAEHPVEGNLLNYLIARGFTTALLKHILPGHPDAVLAVEHEGNKANDGSEVPLRSTTLLRQAIERQDRAMIDGIFKAISYVVCKCVELPPSQREGIYEILLRLEDWCAFVK